MYLDEFGNEWASYEDYADYLNNVDSSVNDQIILEFIKENFKNAHMDSNGTIWAGINKESD